MSISRQSAQPTLSILVATWNCAAQLEHFLHSLSQQSWCDWELLLLDNASTDGTDLLVEHYQNRLVAPHKLIWTSEPAGLAVGTGALPELHRGR